MCIHFQQQKFRSSEPPQRWWRFDELFFSVPCDEQEAEQKGGLALAQEALRRLHASTCVQRTAEEDGEPQPGFEAAVLRMLVKTTQTKAAAAAAVAAAAGGAGGGEAPQQKQQQQQAAAREMAEALALASRRLREAGPRAFAGPAGDPEILWFAGTAWNAALEAKRAEEWAATASLFCSAAIFQCVTHLLFSLLVLADSRMKWLWRASA